MCTTMMVTRVELDDATEVAEAAVVRLVTDG